MVSPTAPVQDDDAELFAIARKLVNPVVMVGDFDDDDDELDPTYPPPCLWDANKAVEMLIARIEHLSPTPETGLVEALQEVDRVLRRIEHFYRPDLKELREQVIAPALLQCLAG